jgi:hypothetical protein
MSSARMLTDSEAFCLYPVDIFSLETISGLKFCKPRDNMGCQLLERGGRWRHLQKKKNRLL